MRYDAYLAATAAQALCDAPKYLESVVIHAMSGEDSVEFYFPVGVVDDCEVFLFVRWSPGGEDMTAALTAGRRQVRRLDTDEHRGKQPHVHFFDGTREMHGDVRAVPAGWNAQGDLAKLLREFANSVNLTISEIVFTLDTQTQFESDL